MSTQPRLPGDGNIAEAVPSAPLRKQGGRLVYLDYLRVTAVFAVVVAHMSAKYWNDVSVDTAVWQVLNLYDSFSRWSVPVFIMISGALFLDSARPVTTRDILLRRCPRIICAFIFWSAVYTVRQLLQEGFSPDLIVSFLTGPAHMWFLFVITGLYIITPLVRAITASEKTAGYFLAVSLFFTFLFPRVLSLGEFFDSLPGIQRLFAGASGVYSQLNFHFTLGFTAYYVLGHCLNHRTFSRRSICGLSVLGVLGLFATFWLTSAVSRRQGQGSEFFYGPFSLLVALESAAVFAAAKHVLTAGRFPRLDRAVRLLSECSFGIYLVHPLVIDVLDRMGLNALAFDPVFAVPVFSVLTFVVSTLLSAALNKVPVLKKYIV